MGTSIHCGFGGAMMRQWHLALLLLFITCASPQKGLVPDPSKLQPGAQATEEKELRDVLEEESGPQETKFDIPILINERVEYFINYFQTKQRQIFTRWLARSERYIPMMKAILRDHGLPEDLVYMAMIESGFNPRAYSRRRASGPWQFITRTGMRYGLRVEWWIDERRDPERSTVAAALYLQDLYEMFGSWYLAAAAYNAGEKKIVKAMMRHQTEDFWEMTRSRYLRRETKDYVPKLIAAALIAKDPEKYGFTGMEYEEPVEYETVDVPPAIDLRAVARACETDYEDIRALNPSLLRGATPPTSSTISVRVPKGAAETFASNFPALESSGRMTLVTHRIRRGETLSEIARGYGIGIEPIKQINGIRSTRYVRAGREIVIPLPGLVPRDKIADLVRKQKERDIEAPKEQHDQQAAVPPLSAAPDGEAYIYEVQDGDT